MTDEITEITAAGEHARAVLEGRHQAREVMLGSSRRAIRSCATAIRAVHRDEHGRARELIAEAATYLGEVDVAVGEEREIANVGLHADAQKEFTEANLTLAFASGTALPTAEELGVGVAPYLNGMAEAASELRRRALDRLRRGEVEEAEGLLGTMDEVYSMLVTVDYPDAVTGGLRRSTDALRAVLERTRGDVTTAIVATRLQEAVERARP